jgi:hypothetical protein
MVKHLLVLVRIRKCYLLENDLYPSSGVLRNLIYAVAVIRPHAHLHPNYDPALSRESRRAPMKGWDVSTRPSTAWRHADVSTASIDVHSMIESNQRASVRHEYGTAKECKGPCIIVRSILPRYARYYRLLGFARRPISLPRVQCIPHWSQGKLMDSHICYVCPYPRRRLCCAVGTSCEKVVQTHAHPCMQSRPPGPLFRRRTSCAQLVASESIK